MSQGDTGSIFPLIERQTPVLDKIRARKNGEGGVNLYDAIALHEQSDNNQVKLEALITAEKSFREELADSLNTEPEQINDELVDSIMESISEIEVISEAGDEEDNDEDEDDTEF